MQPVHLTFQQTYLTDHAFSGIEMNSKYYTIDITI